MTVYADMTWFMSRLYLIIYLIMIYHDSIGLIMVNSLWQHWNDGNWIWQSSQNSCMIATIFSSVTYCSSATSYQHARWDGPNFVKICLCLWRDARGVVLVVDPNPMVFSILTWLKWLLMTCIIWGTSHSRKPSNTVLCPDTCS